MHSGGPMSCKFQQLTRLLTTRALSCAITIFSLSKLCLATATHNFKKLQIYVICDIQVPYYRCRYNTECLLFSVSVLYGLKQYIIIAYNFSCRTVKMNEDIDDINQVLYFPKSQSNEHHFRKMLAPGYFSFSMLASSVTSPVFISVAILSGMRVVLGVFWLLVLNFPVLFRLVLVSSIILVIARRGTLLCSVA